MSKHTPGPWHVASLDWTDRYGKKNLNFFKDVDGEQKYFPAFTVPEVMTLGDYESDGMELANARLVAAAPTMLEALKDVDRWLMAGFEDSDAASASLHPSFRKAFAKTRAAIKLAEGGE